MITGNDLIGEARRLYDDCDDFTTATDWSDAVFIRLVCTRFHPGAVQPSRPTRQSLAELYRPRRVVELTLARRSRSGKQIHHRDRQKKTRRRAAYRPRE